MNSLPLYSNSPSVRQRQSGLALMVALIALAAMTLAGVALVRSIDTNALIAGNLAFRQNATTSGDKGVEAARTWLINKSSTSLESDATDSGYYATRMSGLDLTGSRTKGSDDNVKWIDASGEELAGAFNAKCDAANDATGNRMCYIIQRMCSSEGSRDDPDNGCSLTWSGNTSGNSKGAMQQNVTYQQTLVGSGNSMTYYRITVRVAGPRNNNSYVQVFVQR